MKNKSQVQKQQNIKSNKEKEQKNFEQDYVQDYVAEKQYVVFQLDKQEYGIDIMQVHEINRLKDIMISPVPKTYDFVKGIINLRGEVVPVVDLREKLGLPTKKLDKISRILIVKIENKIIGLLVDGVSEVINIYENNIGVPPEEVTDVSTRYLAGVAKVEKNRLILLLDVSEILIVNEFI